MGEWGKWLGGGGESESVGKNERGKKEGNGAGCVGVEKMVGCGVSRLGQRVCGRDSELAESEWRGERCGGKLEQKRADSKRGKCQIKRKNGGKVGRKGKREKWLGGGGENWRKSVRWWRNGLELYGGGAGSEVVGEYATGWGCWVWNI
jgi:hypothetical protein